MMIAFRNFVIALAMSCLSGALPNSKHHNRRYGHV